MLYVREFDVTNCLAACAHLTITVSEIQRDIRFDVIHERDRRTDGHRVKSKTALMHMHLAVKIAIFTTFLFLLETPLRLSRNMLHGWKANSVLAKPLAACTYLDKTSSSPFALQAVMV